MGLRKFLNQVRMVPTGFKRLFFDCIESVKLKRKSRVTKLTRKEKELVRHSFGAATRMGFFFLLQAPPIIGLVPIFIYLKFPRHLLSFHFWSEQQRIDFAADEYRERRQFAMQLQLLPPKPMPSSSFNFPSNLSTAEWKNLCGALGVHTFHVLITLEPLWFLKYKLKGKLAVIAEDDVYLREEGLEDLTLEESREACLLRGLTQIESDLNSSSSSTFGNSNPGSIASSVSFGDLERAPLLQLSPQNKQFSNQAQHQDSTESKRQESAGDLASNARYKQALRLWLASNASQSLQQLEQHTIDSSSTLSILYAIARPDIYVNGYKPETV